MHSLTRAFANAFSAVSFGIGAFVWDLTRDIYAIVRARFTGGNNITLERTRTVVSNLPWDVLPFSLGMFVLVEGLSVTGWVDLLATALADIVPDSISGLFVVSFISSFAAQILNNQPMTILFVRIFSSPNFVAPDSVEESCRFGLIMGSNFGANISFLGALGGVMWKNIVAAKGFNITAWNFTKHGLLVMPQVLLAASLTLFLEELVYSAIAGE